MIDISVVIPTGRLRPSLAPLLDFLVKIKKPALEIIVVIDGVERYQEWVQKYPTCVFLCTGAQRGPATARNLGAKSAVGKLLVFMDDDVIPEEGGMSAIGDAFQKDSCAWVGSVKPHPRVKDNLYVQFAYGGAAYGHSFSDGQELSYLHYCTSFAAVDKALFDELGGFDERFPAPGYEDVELGYRIHKKGVRIRFCSAAQVYHLKDMDRAWFVSRAYQSGRLLRLLHTIHPEIRRDMHDVPVVVQNMLLYLGVCWPFMKTGLPLVEKAPSRWAICFLRVMNEFGLAHGYRSFVQKGL